LKILVLESLDWSTIFGSIDFWPKSFTVGIQTGLVGIDSFSAFYLMMSLFSAENAGHLVFVVVVARVVGSPG
jgi:hypothetical protein